MCVGGGLGGGGGGGGGGGDCQEAVSVVPGELPLGIVVESREQVPTDHVLAGQNDVLLGHMRSDELRDLHSSPAMH